MAGIEGALHYFGGVPQELLFDNTKCLMIERDAYGEGQHRWNASRLAMSQDFGFKCRACRPYRAQTKSKVERFNGYLKGSFITPLAASLKQAGLRLDVDIANAQVGPWLAEVAHQRIHGTTGEKPEVRLATERLSLMPLPRRQESACPVVVLRNDVQANPVESFQHPLSRYDELLDVAL